MSTSDGGPRDGAPDAPAGGDAGPLRGCGELSPSDPDNQLTVFQPGEVPAFVLDVAYIRWNELDCGHPTLLIGLTDGSCEPGHGQQLLLAVSEEAIGGTVTEGDFVLTSDPTPLRLTFSRPDPTMPADREVFGTCGEVLGTLSFESVGADAGSLWQASFTGVELGSCETPEDPSVLVEGRFALTLPHAFAEVCP